VHRFASCIGQQDTRCSPNFNEEPETSPTETETFSKFLGNNLDVASTKAALYAQFVLLIGLVVILLLFFWALVSVKEGGSSSKDQVYVNDVVMNKL